MVFYPGTPPTRQISWQQLVRENDPNFTRLSLRPWVFEFSNGRLFVDALPLYSGYEITEELLLTNDQPLSFLSHGPVALVEQ